MARYIILVVLIAAGVFPWGGLEGQERTVVPALALKPAAESSSGPSDLSKLPQQQRHLYVSAKSGMEWLARVNRSDGRFLPGYLPALRVPMDGDNYLHQAAAAGTLARAASYFQDERGLALAKQTLLTLLLETTTDKVGRFTAAPDGHLNRLAAAGGLVAAIHELPNPAADLVQQADELAQFIRSQQGAGGGFVNASDDAAAKTDFIQHCTGPALHGLMRSHVRQPEPWKLEAVRKGCAHYHAWWRQHKSLAMIPEHTAAYAEAFLISKEPTFASCVFEMNDWLCDQQYTSVDSRRGHWVGGFPPASDDKSQAFAPDVHSAAAAGSLVQACRAARHAGDAQRFERYRAALERCLLFVTTLQYCEANTRHFADGYRHTVLVGGFYRSHQDGNLRLDYTQQAVAALVHHLQHVAELPK